jgi:hypothetical protein
MITRLPLEPEAQNTHTQQSAIGKGGGGGGNKDDREEDCDGCWRMTVKVAAALAKRMRVQQ